MTRRGSGVNADGLLRIHYPHGRMCVRVDSFFPAASADVRKLMKVLAMDPDRGPAARELLEYLGRMYDPEQYAKSLTEHANAVVNGKTSLREQQERVDALEARVGRMKDDVKQMPKGPEKKQARERLKKAKEALRAAKEVRNGLKEDVSFHNGQFIRKNAERKKYEKDIALIRELSSGWF